MHMAVNQEQMHEQINDEDDDDAVLNELSAFGIIGQ